MIWYVCLENVASPRASLSFSVRWAGGVTQKEHAAAVGRSYPQEK